MRIINLQAVRPDGATVKYLTRSLETTKGVAELDLSIALNEPIGTWLLTFTDAATGLNATTRVNVE